MPDGFLDKKANLAGKTAVLVGGGGGIGACCSMALARAGVNIAFCDIDEVSMEVTEEQVRELGVKVIAQRVDVCSAEELDNVYAAVSGWTESLDIVVNVAGGVKRGDFMDGNREKDAT